jgi:hypothetical protein
MAREFSWLFIAAFGAAAIYFALDFQFGTRSNVGSAVYPLLLSSAVVVISLYSFFFGQTEEPMPQNHRALICIAASVLLFILLIEEIGMLPTTVLCMAVAYAGQTHGNFRFFLIYATIFAVVVWLLFSFALSLPIPPVRMP